MHEQDKPVANTPRYPTGRGYGHDYMRGGEVFGGYGYAERPDYERRRGDPGASPPDPASAEPGSP
jgi:hypothetical protein